MSSAKYFQLHFRLWIILVLGNCGGQNGGGLTRIHNIFQNLYIIFTYLCTYIHTTSLYLHMYKVRPYPHLRTYICMYIHVPLSTLTHIRTFAASSV